MKKQIRSVSHLNSDFTEKQDSLASVKQKRINIAQSDHQDSIEIFIFTLEKARFSIFVLTNLITVSLDSVKESDYCNKKETFIFTIHEVKYSFFPRIPRPIWWHIKFLISSCTALNFIFNQSKLSPGLRTQQTTAAKYNSNNQIQSNFFIRLWNKVFKDIHERLCAIQTPKHQYAC